MKKIQRRVRIFEDEKMDKQLIEIEAKKNDSKKCLQAIRTLNSKKPKKLFIIHKEDDSIAGSEKEQINVITKYFEKIFEMETKEQIPIIPSHEMKAPFTGKKIQKAAESSKNRKSVGEDNLNAEFLKYGPPILHDSMAKLLNKMASTRKYPKQINQGILVPFQKPGKRQEPQSNLRPIILLSILRKILAICMIRRCWDHLSTKISN